MRITLETTGLDTTGLATLQDRLADRAGLHAQIAGDAEKFVKTRGFATAQTEHRSAAKLGASPTGHLERAYNSIESTSDATAAVLHVPRASRLRAAFGAYVLTPVKSKYLTIPVDAESYGRRAREFEDLAAARLGPRKTLFLIRQLPDGKIQTLYVLVKSASIPADPSLIPFADLEQEAADSAEEYYDEIVRKAITQ